MRLSKYKNIFPKSYAPNWSEEVFNGDEIVGTFYEEELRKTNQREFRIAKMVKERGNKLYVKWKGYDNSFNS